VSVSVGPIHGLLMPTSASASEGELDELEDDDQISLDELEDDDDE